VRALISRVYPLVKATGTLGGTIVVGRAPADGVDVVIADPSISKRHCELTPGDGVVNMVDCGSTNGTMVNGAAVHGAAPARLCGGEVLTLGRVEMTFETAAGFVELLSGLGGTGR
jgi:pSer/pThr/pTyr-binding forkhead associated (FHA) protein